jgi:hypothetical protein
MTDFAFEMNWYALVVQQANALEGDCGARAFAYENSLEARGLTARDPVDPPEEWS